LNKAFLLFPAQRFQAADEWLEYIQGGRSEAQPSDDEVQPDYLNSYWIGRAPEADDEGQLVYIDNTQESSLVSRTHAVVYEFENRYLIKDVSTNGLSITVWNDTLQTKEHRTIKGSFSTEEDVFTLDLAGYKLSLTEMLKGHKRTIKISEFDSGIDKVVSETVERKLHHNADNISQVQPQIAAVDLRPASFGRRLGSHILAGMVFTIFLLIITMLAEREFNGIGFSISSFGWLIYALFTICWWSISGKDLGKKMTGLKVIDKTTGMPPVWYRSLLRWLGYILSTMSLGLGHLWMLWDKDQQTWQDKLANTLVVSDFTVVKSHVSKRQDNE
jgi:uncharacterized RDD family membrane protein YckC